MVVTLGNNPPTLAIASLSSYACVVVPPTLNHNERAKNTSQEHPLLLAPRHHHPLMIAINSQNTARQKDANVLTALARNICETIKAYSAGVIMASNKTNLTAQQLNRVQKALALASPN